MVEVLLPASPDEAAQAFGDGDGVTVLGGGTIVVPEITHGRLRPGRVLMLGRSGLDGVSRARRHRHDRRGDIGRGARGRRRAARHRRSPRLRPGDPGTGNGGRQPLRPGERRGAAWRPPGAADRARRAGPLDGRGRRAHGADRGVPRRAGRTARARRRSRRTPRGEPATRPYGDRTRTTTRSWPSARRATADGTYGSP